MSTVIGTWVTRATRIAAVAADQPDRTARRVAVILGAGRSGRDLLDLVLPLLARDRDIEMQGVFLEEAELQHAAELPFVKELCRVTFSVREFTTDQFERALVLRMRSARRALSVLARRTGVQHSFRKVRGPAIALLRETATGSDVTVFEPARALAGVQTGPARRIMRPVAVVVGDLESGRKAIAAAAHLAENDARRLSVLVSPEVAADRQGLASLLGEFLPARPMRVRVVPPDTGVRGLVEAALVEGAVLFVAAATDDLLQPSSLHYLREKLRCPICLVRKWDERRKSVNE